MENPVLDQLIDQLTGIMMVVGPLYAAILIAILAVKLLQKDAARRERVEYARNLQRYYDLRQSAIDMGITVKDTDTGQDLFDKIEMKRKQNLRLDLGF